MKNMSLNPLADLYQWNDQALIHPRMRKKDKDTKMDDIRADKSSS